MLCYLVLCDRHNKAFKFHWALNNAPVNHTSTENLAQREGCKTGRRNATPWAQHNHQHHNSLQLRSPAPALHKDLTVGPYSSAGLVVPVILGEEGPLLSAVGPLLHPQGSNEEFRNKVHSQIWLKSVSHKTKQKPWIGERLIGMKKRRRRPREKVIRTHSTHVWNCKRMN